MKNISIENQKLSKNHEYIVNNCSKIRKYEDKMVAELLFYFYHLYQLLTMIESYRI